MTNTPGAHILVVDDSRLSAKMIQDRLEAVGYRVAVAHDGEQGLAAVRATPPDLVLSDVVMPGIDGYEFVRRLRKYPPTARIPIIMLTSKGGIAEKTRGFEAGADDYLVKPVDPAELELRIRALLARAMAATGAITPQTSGQIVAVFSLKGGVGVSSVAVNLAVALAQMWQMQVPLIDLALESAHGALMLDIKARPSLAELATVKPEDLEPEVLNAYLQPHESGVRLLQAPLRPELAEQITPTAIAHILTLAQSLFGYLVLDLPSTFCETTLAALDLSAVVVLLLSPDLAALKCATAALDVFAALGYPEERVLPVLNWTFPREGLPQKNIEAALKRHIPLVIPYDPTLFVESINRGLPAIWRKPQSAASMAIARLAYAISRSLERENIPESPPALLARVLSQLK
ncbi:MAG: AAA family ATPase [Chloroflexota bacterium]